jgi:transposase-like protein
VQPCLSVSAIRAINHTLDEMERFAWRGLAEAYSHLVLDARWEKVREDINGSGTDTKITKFRAIKLFISIT